LYIRKEGWGHDDISDMRAGRAERNISRGRVTRSKQTVRLFTREYMQ